MSETKHTLNPETWTKDYGNMLYGFASGRVNDKEVARDLVQETFLSALRSIDRFRGEVSEQSWLFTILRNKIIDYYRKAGRSVMVEIADEDNSDFFDEKGSWQKQKLPENWKFRPDRAFENEEFMQMLEKCKQTLPELHRAVFTLKYMLGEDSDFICKELGITKSNYWTMMHRAKLKLRECLEKIWINQ